LGPYGPSIWILSFSWILTGIVFIALFRLLVSSRARIALGSAPTKKTVLFLFLVLVFAAYALTRYETFANPRYFLAIAPLLILNSLVALRVLSAWASVRQAVLAGTFVLLLASNFRTLDPVSRAVWGTFSFGRHAMLRLTSWTGECCGYGRDQ